MATMTSGCILVDINHLYTEFGIVKDDDYMSLGLDRCFGRRPSFGSTSSCYLDFHLSRNWRFLF